MVKCHIHTILEPHIDIENSGSRKVGWTLVVESFKY